MGEKYEIFEDGEAVDRFEVRDLRVKTRFALDNIFFDVFTPAFGATLSMIYIALVRHSNKEQKTWPSQKRISEQVGVGRNWVGMQLQVLECFQLVKKVRLGKMCTNRYYLVDEKYWRQDTDLLISQLATAMKFRGYSLPEKVMHTELPSLKSAVMHTELPSLMLTGMSRGALSTTLQCAVQLASNSKDKQSKDKQKGQGVKKVMKTIVKKSDTTRKTGVVERGEGAKKREFFDEGEGAIVREFYD